MGLRQCTEKGGRSEQSQRRSRSSLIIHVKGKTKRHMITRYYVACPGCDSTILLRLSVGLEREQPFYFVCRNCNAATRGKLVIWYEPCPGGKLELEAGTVIDGVVPHDQVVNIHPSFPSIPEAGEIWEEGGSPFLMHQKLLGDRFSEVNSRLNTFCQAKDKDWPKLRRLIGYYIDRNWKPFDDEGRRIFEEEWPRIADDWHRHDIIHKLLDVFLLPLCVNRYYLDMKIEWCTSSIFKHPSKILFSFVSECVESGELRSAQRDIFHCLEQFVENTGGLLPGLSVLLYDGKNRPSNLRLFRDDFPRLRDLYVATFETCHHLLRYPLATINIQERKNAGDFGVGRKKSLGAFDKLKNAKKAEYLDCLPVWQAYWPIVLDRNLRNLISHHEIRHDLPSGKLVVPGEEIPYSDFVSKCILLIHPILAMANALKTLLVAHCLQLSKRKK